MLLIANMYLKFCVWFLFCNIYAFSGRLTLLWTYRFYAINQVSCGKINIRTIKLPHNFIGTWSMSLVIANTPQTIVRKVMYELNELPGYHSNACCHHMTQVPNNNCSNYHVRQCPIYCKNFRLFLWSSRELRIPFAAPMIVNSHQLLIFNLTSSHYTNLYY